MFDTRNVTIAMLAITAAILFVGLILVSLFPQQAHAVGQMDRGGDYVIATGQHQDSLEYLYVTDAAIGRLNVYALDKNKNQIDLIDTFDLAGRMPQTPSPMRTR